jgi:hypothetical protein
MTDTATLTTFHGLSRKAAELLVWRTTHRDFRSNGTGERRVMMLTKEGWTASVALVDLPTDELLQRVAYGVRLENRKRFLAAGLVVYPRSGAWAGAVDLDGRAYVVNLMTGEQRTIAEPVEGAAEDERMTAAFRASEAAADTMQG